MIWKILDYLHDVMRDHSKAFNAWLGGHPDAPFCARTGAMVLERGSYSPWIIAYFICELLTPWEKYHCFAALERFWERNGKDVFPPANG